MLNVWPKTLSKENSIPVAMCRGYFVPCSSSSACSLRMEDGMIFYFFLYIYIGCIKITYHDCCIFLDQILLHYYKKIWELLLEILRLFFEWTGWTVICGLVPLKFLFLIIWCSKKYFLRNKDKVKFGIYSFFFSRIFIDSNHNM